MKQHHLIEDPKAREIINQLKKSMDRIENIPQLPTDATTADIIKVINKITDSIKRRR